MVQDNDLIRFEADTGNKTLCFESYWRITQGENELPFKVIKRLGLDKEENRKRVGITINFLTPIDEPEPVAPAPKPAPASEPETKVVEKATAPAEPIPQEKIITQQAQSVGRNKKKAKKNYHNAEGTRNKALDNLVASQKKVNTSLNLDTVKLEKMDPEKAQEIIRDSDDLSKLRTCYIELKVRKRNSPVVDSLRDRIEELSPDDPILKG